MEEKKIIRTALDPTPRSYIPNMYDHSKDPFLVKKKKAAEELIEKYGLPKGWELKEKDGE